MVAHKNLFIGTNFESLLPNPLAAILTSYKTDLVIVKALETEFMCLHAITKAKPGSKTIADRLRDYTAQLANCSKTTWQTRLQEDTCAVISGYLMPARNESSGQGAKRRTRGKSGDAASVPEASEAEAADDD